MRTLNREELVDILMGCTILGTGGGGSPEKGIELVDKALALGKDFILADYDELDPDDLVGTPYGCGAISPISEELERQYANLPVVDELPELLAMRQAEEYIGKEMRAVSSTELGGGNTAYALYCAAMAGKLIADGDPAGRSVPRLDDTTYLIHNVPMTPISCVNNYGEGAIFTKVVNDARAEVLVRALAVVSKNSIGVVDHIQPASVLKNAVIRGAITHAEKIGKAFRLAKEAGEDFVDAVAKAGEGKRIFEGEIVSNDWETRDGFTFGTQVMKGTGNYAGREYKIWYQNENIITWMDGEYYAVVPDLVCVFDRDADKPLLNPHGQPGQKVSIIVLPAPEMWRSERGLEIFGPKSFGHDIDWKPFCQ